MTTRRVKESTALRGCAAVAPVRAPLVTPPRCPNWCVVPAEQHAEQVDDLGPFGKSWHHFSDQIMVPFRSGAGAVGVYPPDHRALMLRVTRLDSYHAMLEGEDPTRERGDVELSRLDGVDLVDLSGVTAHSLAGAVNAQLRLARRWQGGDGIVGAPTHTMTVALHGPGSTQLQVGSAVDGDVPVIYLNIVYAVNPTNVRQRTRDAATERLPRLIREQLTPETFDFTLGQAQRFAEALSAVSAMALSYQGPQDGDDDAA